MATSSDKVKAALIGCGGFSKERPQAALMNTGLYDIVSCYDVARPAAEEAALKLGARPCASLEEALAVDGVEAAILITPNPLHRAQTEAALAAGKHVFVEKPMANTVADGLAMVRAADKARRILMVGHMTRRYRAFRLLHEFLKAGRLGRPLVAEAHFSHLGGRQLSPPAWRADPAQCPGLPLNVIGCHLVDVLNMFFGRPHMAAAFHRRAVVPTNNDCTTTILAYDEPLAATVVSLYVTPQVHEVRVVGTDLVAEVHAGGGRVVLRDTNKTVEEHEFQGPSTALLEEYAEFARAVRHGTPVETDGRCGLLTVAVIEASVISAREQRFVSIDDLLQGM